MKGRSTNVWTDPELAYLYASDASLLALADAVVATGGSRALPGSRSPLRTARVAALAAALLAVLVVVSPAFGVGSQLWNLITGTPVATTSISSYDWTALSSMNANINGSSNSGATPATVKNLAELGYSSIDKIADLNGQSFYVLQRTSGATCYATGQTGGLALTPADPAYRNDGFRNGSLFSQVACPGAPTSEFPSQQQPILDLSVLHGQPGYVSELEGFAADPVAKVGVIGTDGQLYDVTSVENNVYEASNLPTVDAKELVAFDSTGKQVYSECLDANGCS
jgi:hypothetical protein